MQLLQDFDGMDNIFREWLFAILREGALDDKEIKLILRNEANARQLLKDFFEMNYYEILPWIKDEVSFFQKLLENEENNGV